MRDLVLFGSVEAGGLETGGAVNVEPNRVSCGNIRGQAQSHSYHILSLDDMDITIKSKSVGSMKIKAINWLEEVGGFNVQASISIQDVNTKPL